MFKSIVSMSAFVLFAGSAFAQSNAAVGHSDLFIQPDHFGSSEISTTEHANGQITGNGQGEPNANITMVNLARQNGGIKGQIFGRFVNIVCTATTCTDQGSLQLNMTVKNNNGVIQLEGDFNFNFVRVTLSANQISVSTNSASYEMTKQANGHFTGQGAYSSFSMDPTFNVVFQSDGTLANITQDPAAALALLVSPFVR
jgi:hypothetical protein